MKNNPIWQTFSRWYQRNFSDPNAVNLFLGLLFTFIFLQFFSGFFMVILVSIVLAYLLTSPVRFICQRLHLSHLISVLIVYVLFLAVVVLAIIGLFPLLWQQLGNLLNELPIAISHSQQWVASLLAKYPHVLPQLNLNNLMAPLQTFSAKIGQLVLKYSWAVIPNLFQVVVYLVLVPLFVLFFLKDQAVIMNWFKPYWPENRTLLDKVWQDLNEKIGCYVRGRVVEIIIVSIVTSIAFLILGLQYGLLLGALVGLSVIVPYVGAIIVTIPILIIGLMQWGVTFHFTYLVIVYALIILLDGYLLVPLLFSEAMELHPVVILLSVVVFGILWGFWGVFFAIPLATLINVVLKAWPRQELEECGPVDNG